MSARSTPWGQADQIEQIGDGIYFASTPSHGGYFVPSNLLPAIPEQRQQRALYWSGSRNWFEEDCEWASVALAFPALFDQRALQAAAAMIPTLDRDAPKARNCRLSIVREYLANGLRRFRLADGHLPEYQPVVREVDALRWLDANPYGEIVEVV